MPVQDDEGKAVGTLFYEDPTTGNYSLCFVTICFTSQTMKLYPPKTQGEPDLSKFEVISEIKCQYITKVGSASSRPKVLNCFEIVTTGVIHHFAVDSIEERDEWIEIIKQSSMRQGSYKNITTKNREHSKGVGYKTQIVGGVIRRIPIQGELTEDSDRTDLTSSGPATIGATALDQNTPTVTSGKCSQQHLLKAGYATKCGAVMKSWKRRFFIVTEESFGYYKSLEETDPIRSVSVSEFTAVSKSKVHSGKEHLLEVATPQRTFYIQADSDTDMHEWIKAFQAVMNMKRTSMTLPVTTKERTSSLSNTLDNSNTTVVQNYDSSPNLSVSKNIKKSAGLGEDEDVDTDEDYDQTLGTDV